MGYCAMQLSDIEDPQVRRALAGHAPQAAAERYGEEVNAMPAGDGTGPMGMGPMTGRAAGYCAGYPAPGYANPMAGRPWYGTPPVYGPGAYPAPYGYGPAYAPGFGFGRGWFGRGFGRGFGRRWIGRGFGRGFGRGRGWVGW